MCIVFANYYITEVDAILASLQCVGKLIIKKKNSRSYLHFLTNWVENGLWKKSALGKVQDGARSHRICTCG